MKKYIGTIISIICLVTILILLSIDNNAKYTKGYQAGYSKALDTINAILDQRVDTCNMKTCMGVTFDDTVVYYLGANHLFK